jgi:hypothetical protein
MWFRLLAPLFVCLMLLTSRTAVALQLMPLRHSTTLLRTITTTTFNRIGTVKEESRLPYGRRGKAVGVATSSGGRDDGAIATKNTKQKTTKKHFLLGTPTLPPWTYPLLDAAFIVTYSYICYFLLTGRTRLVHAIWCGLHVPLAIITNYYSRFLYLFPNLPIVPLPIMYLYDATWAVFIILSPFFLQYNKAWHMLIHMIGSFSLLSLAFLDPKPYEEEKKQSS